MRVLDHLLKAVRSAAIFNPEIQVAPACILWPDRDRQWEAVIPRLQAELPELIALGDYDPEKRVGPAIWLRCVIAGKEGEVSIPQDRTPVIYLPGISRQDLRAVESCPDHLKPLAELQYRGVIWSQISAKDWTILSFLKSDQGGLGLDVAQDNNAKNAMQLALYRLLDEEIDLLRGKRLDKDYFNTLLTGGDPVRDLLQWLDQAEVFRAAREENEWKAFIEVCKSQLAFNPEKEGVLAGAAKLAVHEGPWQTVWARFCEAPHRYPSIPGQIQRNKAPVDNIFWLSEDGGFDGWPQWNDDQEKNLRNDLLGLANVAEHIARKKIGELEKRHGRRRDLVWVEVGDSPLALSLEHLAQLAEYTKNGLVAGTLQDVTAGYRSTGWQADHAVIMALVPVKAAQDLEAVTAAIRSIYEPWLQASSRYLQKIVQEAGYPGGTITSKTTTSFNENECILFVDGLRFDTAKKLAAFIAGQGCRVEEKLSWAALPSVTATGKPSVAPICDHVFGFDTNADFEPCVRETQQSLASGYHFKKLLTNAGYMILDYSDSGDGFGKAWCEFGDIDHEGHDKGWKLSKQIDTLLKEVRDRILELLSAGWKNIRVVTDHGWLLLPGNLPKIELPAALAEKKWGRCATIKPGASTDEKLYPWFWNPDFHIALADGISCFREGREYDHGGLSFQECLTLELTITKSDTCGESVSAEITDVAWKGLRCTIAVDGQFPGLTFDLRLEAGDASSSIVMNKKPVKETGKASVVVEDDALEGKKATIVLLGANDKLVAQTETVIGGGDS